MFEKIICGFQNGADIAGARFAKKFGISTGGHFPKGGLTDDGYHLEYKEMYGAEEDESCSYPPRTYKNVKNSDGTIRFASNFSSPGEQCTRKAIRFHKRPFIDVNILNPVPHQKVLDWLKRYQIKILNVAGNRESTCPGIGAFVEDYLEKVYTLHRHSLSERILLEGTILKKEENGVNSQIN